MCIIRTKELLWQEKRKKEERTGPSIIFRFLSAGFANGLNNRLSLGTFRSLYF